MEPSELLRLVDESPARVAAHDKEGWLDLFADGAVVEDPVGTAPHRKGAGSRAGEDELSRFYETFIAPNQIRFEVRADIVAPPEVVRDVVIHTTLSSGLEVRVPARLLYRACEEEGGLVIERMAAHWELRSISTSALSGGLKGLSTMASLSLHVLGQQGLGGSLGYSRGMVSGIFGRGPRMVEELCAAIEARDEERLLALFVDDEPRVELPRGTARSPSDFLAGLEADAQLTASEPIPAGWVTTFAFRLAGGADRDSHGIAFAEHDRSTKRILALRFYCA